MPPIPHPVVASALFSIGLATGCGFFEELQSAESVTEQAADTDGDTEGWVGTDTDGCMYPADDACMDQDTVLSCDLATASLTVYDCAALCGNYVNFTCLNTSAGHGCWCVEPGKQKVLSCSELESCLRGCTWDTTSACADQCFSRTTTSTIRMYGSLVGCAHTDCHDVCIDMPQACAACIDQGIAAGSGPCALERSVCDADKNDEEPY